MAETGFDLETGRAWNQAGVNGHQPELALVDELPDDISADDEPHAARVDPLRGVFITSKGDEVELSGKRITSLMLDRIANQGRPRIPDVEVLLLGKTRRLQANPNDEGYKAQLAEWEQESKIRSLQYVYTLGVKGQPPPEFAEEQRAFFGDASDLEIKYLWVASLIPDDDVQAFTEAVMGYTAPTTKGIEQAAASFRSDG